MLTILKELRFGLSKSVPLLHQAESAECGLACLGMVAGYYGQHRDMAGLRAQFGISSRGLGLAQLIKMAGALQLNTRALKLDLDALAHLRLPCILHWDFNHFVVLRAVTAKRVTVHDPALGIRHMSRDSFGRHFTGVGLEVWPNERFETRNKTTPLKIRELMGNVSGLKRSAIQIGVLALGMELLALLNPFYLQWVVDQGLVSADYSLLTQLAVGFCVLMLFQQCINAARGWAVLYLGTLLKVQWRSNVFAHLQRLPVQYFERRHLGDVVSRFDAVEDIQRTLTSSFIEAVLDGTMALCTLTMMLVLANDLAYVVIGAMLMYALSRRAAFALQREASSEQIIHTAKQQTHLLETLRGMKVIKLFGRHLERRTAWQSLLVNQVNATTRVETFNLMFRQLNGLLFGLQNVLVIWLGSRAVLAGGLSAGTLLAFIGFKAQFDLRVSGLIDKAVDLKMLRLHADRLTDIVSAEPELHADQVMSPEIASTAITIRGLTFKYADHEPFILEGLDLDIREGESLALAGPSGCGKTTLMNIMLGVLTPTAGEIKIGNVDLARAGPQALRSICGAVLQDDCLFAGSIAENISCFDPSPDLDWIVACASMAGISNEIARMPMAFHTLVGDMGTVLSGGQKQRILLARALYKRPRILFLDEATSHLDIDNERIVNDAIRKLNITRVMIAHRPQTLAIADRIVYLEQGRVVSESDNAPRPS